MPVTQEQLNHAVDQQFFQQHPDAPRKLDPHEPTHQHYVAEWNQIRDHTANQWSDHYLKQFYPDAPEHLDPNNPAHHQYIEYWNDIHHQIRTGEPGRWSWSSPPQHEAQGAQHTVGEPHPGPGEQHHAPAGQHTAQGAQHAAEGAQHAAHGSQHGAQAPTAAPPTSQAPQHAAGAESAQTAQSSGWIYLDLTVRTNGVDGVSMLRGYEVWAQPIGTDNWYSTSEPTSGGQYNAIFRDVLVRPEAGVLLHYRATESGLLPELEAQITCEGAEYSNGGNYLRVDLCQQMNAVTIEAVTADEAIQQACSSYPASAYIDEQQRHSTDYPEGMPRKFEVWVGLATVTA